MQHYQYLIVGGGMTADAAVEGIRSMDPNAKIALFSAEVDPPYNRPPLSKGLWKGDSLESIWRKSTDESVSLHLGRTITGIDPGGKKVVDAEGQRYSWEKLLIATGASPRRLAFGGDDVIYFRTLGDYRRLRALAEKGQRFAVIGGGFIGSEIAAALAMNGKDVVMIFPGAGIAHRMFPRDLYQFVSAMYREKGVEMLAGTKVWDLERRGNQLAVKTSAQREIVVDGVIAGLGVEPRVDLAKNAGVKVEKGILVDEFLRTNLPDMFAAGDVAAFQNPALGKRIRVEHEDNALSMGRAAGVNMTGKSEPYHHLPFFYSDMFEFGYEAVGELDSGLETFADWKHPHKEGVIYYLQNQRVRGVLLWNVWGQVDAARKLIAEAGPFGPETLRGRLK
jgi:3-phenylpropionate/trans-cinnamate dioxygenase ferredoxin reductase component